MKMLKDSYDYILHKKCWSSIIKRAEDIQLRFFNTPDKQTINPSIKSKIEANRDRLSALCSGPYHFDLAEGQLVL